MFLKISWLVYVRVFCHFLKRKPAASSDEFCILLAKTQNVVAQRT